MLGLVGLEPGPAGAVKGILTGKDGLGAAATTIDDLTGTGQPAGPYRLPAGQLAAELDNLTALQLAEHQPLNLE